MIMIQKKMNIAITKCYGNADETVTRGKFNIPKKMLEGMGIDENDRTVVVIFNEKKKEITIKKLSSEI